MQTGVRTRVTLLKKGVRLVRIKTWKEAHIQYWAKSGLAKYPKRKGLIHRSGPILSVSQEMQVTKVSSSQLRDFDPNFGLHWRRTSSSLSSSGHRLGFRRSVPVKKDLFTGYNVGIPSLILVHSWCINKSFEEEVGLHWQKSLPRQRKSLSKGATKPKVQQNKHNVYLCHQKTSKRKKDKRNNHLYTI